MYCRECWGLLTLTDIPDSLLFRSTFDILFGGPSVLFPLKVFFFFLSGLWQKTVMLATTWRIIFFMSTILILTLSKSQVKGSWTIDNYGAEIYFPLET